MYLYIKHQEHRYIFLFDILEYVVFEYGFGEALSVCMNNIILKSL